MGAKVRDTDNEQNDEEIQVTTVCWTSSISDALCIPLRYCSTRGKEWSCDRELFHEGGYDYLYLKVSFQAGCIPSLYLR